MIPNTVVGQVIGTGALINVVLGFKPDYVFLENAVTGASLARFRGSTSSTKAVAAGTITVVAGPGAGALADYGSATTTGEGFTIPVDAQVNVATQAINYMAVRSGPGSR